MAGIKCTDKCYDHAAGVLFRGEQLYHNSELFEKCELVLRDWAEHKDEYYSTNWWYQSIDVPKKMSTILLYPLPEDRDYLPALRAVAKKGFLSLMKAKCIKQLTEIPRAKAQAAI